MVTRAITLALVARDHRAVRTGTPALFGQTQQLRLQARADLALQEGGEVAEPREETSFRSLLAELDTMEQGLKTDFDDLALDDEIEAESETADESLVDLILDRIDTTTDRKGKITIIDSARLTKDVYEVSAGQVVQTFSQGKLVVRGSSAQAPA